MLDNRAKAAAMLSSGKSSVRVVDQNGGVHRVLGKDEQTPDDVADLGSKLMQLQEQLSQLIESQVRVTSANVAALAVQVEGMAARLDGVLKIVEAAAAGQKRFEADLSRLIAVMKMPIKPVYNDNGIIIGGVRVEKL